MALDAGKLRERVTVQQATETRNRLGESVLDWGTFAEVWASVEGLSARELFSFGQQQIEVTHRVRIRLRDGITSKMRLLWRGRTLQIISVLEQDDRTMYELICQEAE
jgi:SPP1 family predicted phage head-tail adaptor